MRFFLFCALLCAPLHAGGNDDTSEAAAKVLWHTPPAWTAQDWVCGPGGCDGTPAPPFQFIREETSGTSPKVTVKDSRGRTWSVKFGAEATPECFGSRFVVALGYTAETTYFVATGKIEGVGKLGRAGRFVKHDGSFDKGRFELRGQPDFVFLKDQVWAWDQNPFLGSHELAGLKMVMMLLSNWDAKDAHDVGDSNNGVFRSTLDGKRVDLYCVFDWGASLGAWGGRLKRDKCDCPAFTRDTPHFVSARGGHELEWGFIGKHGSRLRQGISREDVRWLLPYLRQITPEELQAGLKASGATERQAGCWSWGIENRIQQLAAIAQQP